MFMDSEVSVIFQASIGDLSSRNRDSVIGIETRLQLDVSEFESRHGQESFLFAKNSRPLLWISLLCWYRGFFPVCRSGGGMMLTTDLYIAQRLRMPSHHGKEQL
jgi:hypothetical protein